MRQSTADGPFVRHMRLVMHQVLEALELELSLDLVCKPAAHFRLRQPCALLIHYPLCLVLLSSELPFVDLFRCATLSERVNLG